MIELAGTERSTEIADRVEPGLPDLGIARMSGPWGVTTGEEAADKAEGTASGQPLAEPMAEARKIGTA